jgi:ribosomal protein S18 acetylase RimI-like enzyme
MPDIPIFQIRAGTPEDADDFSKLAVISGELLTQLWGTRTEGLMHHLSRFPDTIYGYHHAFFACRDNEIVGFFLGYSLNSLVQEQPATQRRTIDFLGWHYCKRFFTLRSINKALGDLAKKEFLLSNIAVYPEFRHTGAGTRLMKEVIRQAEHEQCTRIVLDVLSDNIPAIRFYEANGFRFEKKRSIIRIDERNFQFNKMVLKLNS